MVSFTASDRTVTSTFFILSLQPILQPAQIRMARTPITAWYLDERSGRDFDRQHREG